MYLLDHMVLNFFLLEFLSHSFNFRTCDWSVHIVYFFLVHLGKQYISKNFLSSNFLGVYFLVVVSYNLFYLCGVSCNISFFISNFIDFFPFFFPLVSLAQCLSILFIFVMNQLLLPLIFDIVFIFSISFFSSDFYFLLLILSFVFFFLCWL